MSSKTILLILLSFTITSKGCSFNKHSRRQTLQSDDKCVCSTAVHYNPLTDSNATVDPHCDCDSSGFGVVRTIPYSCVAGDCDRIRIDLSSACVRCGMCIAIAEEINQTLLDACYIMIFDDRLNDKAELFLRAICDHSFRHYSLREINGIRFISNPLPGDKLITSSADGLWEKNLRSTCHDYLDELQELQLYRNWRELCEDDERALNLEDVFCRNEISGLRDCRGIDNIQKRQLPTNIFADTRREIFEKYIHNISR
ncbi:uncharacterized protein [Linepithema humile]|nr:PREDICTED: uncharacterized protein LOC105679485 [Linepithema humile]